MKFQGFLVLDTVSGDMTLRKTRPSTKNAREIVVSVDISVNAPQFPMPKLVGVIDIPEPTVDEMALMTGGEVVGGIEVPA